MDARKLWYWMNERQKIYLKKERGDSKPWTKDKILQTYKFTNVFRQQDAVTVELSKVLNRSDSHYILLWKIFVFRMFNHPDTYHELNKAGLIVNWDQQRAKKVLRLKQKRREQIFTGAYIITNAGSTRPKIDLMCEALTPMFKDRKIIAAWIKKAGSIEVAVEILRRFPHVGAFVGYEIATDLRHTPMLNKAIDIMTWANPGPGARRGLNRIFRGDKANKEGADHLAEMQKLLSMTHKGKSGLDGEVFEYKVLEMRDIEHSLCEFDKYMRVFNEEGRPRSRYNGKAD